MSTLKNKELIATLADCAAACNFCAISCLQEENVKMMEKCIRTDLDCAAICKMAIDYISRDSRYTREILALCAKICRDCGDECAHHKHDHCQACAEACRRCEEACKKA